MTNKELVVKRSSNRHGIAALLNARHSLLRQNIGPRIALEHPIGDFDQKLKRNTAERLVETRRREIFELDGDGVLARSGRRPYHFARFLDENRVVGRSGERVANDAAFVFESVGVRLGPSTAHHVVDVRIRVGYDESMTASGARENERHHVGDGTSIEEARVRTRRQVDASEHAHVAEIGVGRVDPTAVVGSLGVDTKRRRSL